MLSDEEFFAVKGRAAAVLRKIPGVHSVGIGGRERAGQPTGEPVIKVFVVKKRPLNELPPDQIVPAAFEGVPTDVVESGEDELLQGPPGVPLGTADDEDERRYRPLRGGVQLEGAIRTGHGTIGFLAQVTGDPSAVMAVTAHHVLFYDENAHISDLPVGQPTPDESFSECTSGVFGSFAKGHYDDDVDAAIMRLKPGTEWLAEIENIGPVRGINTITPADAVSGTYHVRKRGRTTRLTGGIVQAVGVVGDVPEGARPRPGNSPMASGSSQIRIPMSAVQSPLRNGAIRGRRS